MEKGVGLVNSPLTIPCCSVAGTILCHGEGGWASQLHGGDG